MFILWYTGLVAEIYKRNPNIKCIICNSNIYRRPFEIKRNKGNVFCGSICYGIYCRKEIECVVCKKKMLSSLNKRTCSRECSNKHRKGIKYKIGRPKDKANTLRLIKIELIKERGQKCERCNYNKLEILHIHHKDKNKNNNKKENLEIICPNCHYEEHLLKKK